MLLCILLETILLDSISILTVKIGKLFFRSPQLDSVHSSCDVSSSAESSKAEQTSHSLSMTGNTTPL